MNTPNKLTLIRIIMVPVFMAFILWDTCPHHYLIAGLLFGAAALTDMLDGRLARKTDRSQRLENLWILLRISY